MGKKSQNKTWKGANIKLNAVRKLERAKRKGKSEAYIHDLETHVSKLK